MSENSSSAPIGKVEQAPAASPAPRKHPWWLVIALPVWTFASFMFAQALLIGTVYGLQAIDVPLDAINPTVFNTLVAATVYILSVAIVIGVPWLAAKRRTTFGEMGVHKWPRWFDIGIMPPVYLAYLICSAVMAGLVLWLAPEVDMTQAQSIGFADLTETYQYVLAFLTLVVLAPFAEEALFRGYLQGKLRQVTSLGLTVIVTSVVFALLHLPGDGALQWNVVFDVFVLSVALCLLREWTGTIWAGVLLHMLKNGIAFYFLFINPSILSTIGG